MKVSEIFDKHSKKYDNERKNLIPCFDNFYNIAIDIIDSENNKPKVLDLGGGTGIMTQFLIEKYPKAQVEIIDLADNMLDIAREKFKDNPNISFRNEDYLKADFDGKYDIIISALSIHHLTKEQKKQIYEKYINLLNDDGIFVNADLFLDEDDKVEKLFYKKTDDLILEKVTLKEFQQANERKKFDDKDTIKYQLDCLKDAGCSIVGVPFKFYNYAIIWGCR